jgi:glycosyltransferase involved in cell wall biosynthesis
MTSLAPDQGTNQEMIRSPADDQPWTVVHDFCFNYGGAERVTETVARRLLPDADVLFLGGSREVAERMGVGHRARFLLPERLVTERNYRQLFPFYAPWLTRIRPLPGNVFASSYAFAHHLPSNGRKVVFCHSPLRHIWSGLEEYQQQFGHRGGTALRTVAPLLRTLDRTAALRADVYVTTSRDVQSRVERYYGLPDTPVVPPPIDTQTFRPEPSSRPGEYYLWVGRIVEPYKRLSLVLEAFAHNRKPLVVAGSGRDEARLRAGAPPNVTFLGDVPSAQLRSLYSGARALVFPSTDDFGMVPLESMACGTPVIAHRSGGALDTVLEGITGVFFDSTNAESLNQAIDRLQRYTWDMATIRAHASEFSEARFVQRLQELLSTPAWQVRSSVERVTDTCSRVSVPSSSR